MHAGIFRAQKIGHVQIVRRIRVPRQIEKIGFDSSF